MKALDILLICLVLWGVYSGFKKGFVAELYSLGAFFIAAMCSLQLMKLLVEFLKTWNIHCNTPASYVLFIVAFLAIVIIVTLLGKLCKYLIHLTALGGVDQLFGAILGAIKWGLCILFFLGLVNMLALPLPESYLVDHYLLPAHQWIEPYCMRWLHNYIYSLQGNYSQSTLSI